jgi:hypothetical protein
MPTSSFGIELETDTSFLDVNRRTVPPCPQWSVWAVYCAFYRINVDHIAGSKFFLINDGESAKSTETTDAWQMSLL